MLSASGLPSTHLMMAFWASPAASIVSPTAISLHCMRSSACHPEPHIQCCSCPIAEVPWLETHRYLIVIVCHIWLGGQCSEDVHAGWRVDKQVESCTKLAAYDWVTLLPGESPNCLCLMIS